MVAKSSKNPDPSEEILQRLQFHLMELSLGKRNIEFIVLDLEEDMKAYENQCNPLSYPIRKNFEELKTHVNSRKRYLLALHLQIEIAKELQHDHIAELKQLLDQVTRHLDSSKYSYFACCFQVALINPGPKEKHHFARELDNIKFHERDNEQFLDQIHQRLSILYGDMF